MLADHPATVQALQQAGGELRRALEGTGTPLLGLDIGASGNSRARATRALDRERLADVAIGAEGASDPTVSDIPRSLALSNGALVDVLA